MVTAGDIRPPSATYHGADGVAADTWRRNIDPSHDACPGATLRFSSG
jgi:hypothetical protein